MDLAIEKVFEGWTEFWWEGRYLYGRNPTGIIVWVGHIRDANGEYRLTLRVNGKPVYSSTASGVEELYARAVVNMGLRGANARETYGEWVVRVRGALSRSEFARTLGCHTTSLIYLEGLGEPPPRSGLSSKLEALFGAYTGLHIPIRPNALDGISTERLREELARRMAAEAK